MNEPADDDPAPNPHDLLRYFQKLTESPAAELCRRGQTLAAGGMHTAALELFQQATAADPAYAKGWSDLGVCLMLLDRLEDAGDALVKALELVPDHVEAWGALGEVCAKTNRLDYAGRCLEACGHLAPNDPRTARLAKMVEALRSDGPAPG